MRASTSGSQKVIRVICIIMIVIAGLSLVLCGLLWTLGLMYAGTGFSGAEESDIENLQLGFSVLLILAAAGTFGSMFNLFIGIYGCVAAGNPRMVSGLFRILCMIAMVVSLLLSIVLAVTGAIEFPGALGIPLEFIIMAVLTLMAGNVKSALDEEAEWRSE